MVKVLFSGCSYFAGDGLQDTINDENNAVNVFVDAYFGSSAKLKNVAVGGNSNCSIYFDTARELYEDHYDYVFVGITSYPRYNFYLGLETYDYKRRMIFSPYSKIQTTTSYEGHQTFSAKWLEDLRDKFLVAHNDHFEILEIIKYQNLLLKQAQLTNTKIFFINNIAHWDSNYFKRLTNFLPNDLTAYTKKLLDTDNRDDQEIFELYDRIHSDYEESGGIKEHHWLNLYNSFYNQKIDLGQDNYHPGPESHRLFGTFLAQQFKLTNG